jgi:quinol monooxygenase YgiN
MFIAIVDFSVAPAQRDVALAVLAREAPLARALPGNLNYRAFTNAGDDSHVGIFHEWRTEADFKGYAASPEFGRLGAQLRPMMLSAPISRRFDAVLKEEVKA